MVQIDAFLLSVCSDMKNIVQRVVFLDFFYKSSNFNLVLISRGIFKTYEIIAVSW